MVNANMEEMEWTPLSTRTLTPQVTRETTHLKRLQSRHKQGTNATLRNVAIQIDQGEEVGQGQNPQELLALLVALGCRRTLERPPHVQRGDCV